MSEMYQKIDSIYKRDEKGRFTEEVSRPEFEYLWNIGWYFTEKIDGTNTRVIWNGQDLEFKGRKDTSEMPVFLKEKLETMFSADDFTKVFGETPVCLYGEGYGKKIQKMGKKYIPDGVSFILFDVKIDGLWLERKNVEDIAEKLGIKVVPIVGGGTLSDAINLIRKGLKSTFGDFLAEGIVIKPKLELFDRRGERIITKLKHRDLGITEESK